MEKSFDFALRIVKSYKFLCVEKKEFILSKQIKEAEHAQSKADFISKMNIALKEANETQMSK